MTESDPNQQESQEANPWRVRHFARGPRLTNFELRRDHHADSKSAAEPAPLPWWRWRDRNLHLAALALGLFVGIGAGLVHGGYVVIRPARANPSLPMAHVAPVACLLSGEES